MKLQVPKVCMLQQAEGLQQHAFEFGTWNLESGTWNLELAIWNLEPGT
jgi:hypothetical protein